MATGEGYHDEDGEDGGDYADEADDADNDDHADGADDDDEEPFVWSSIGCTASHGRSPAEAR